MTAPLHRRRAAWLARLWPLAAVSLAWLPAAQPFANALLPCSDSGLTYLLRAVQFDLNVAGGRPFLAWAPELMHGFGYPVFGFYAPLSSWLLEILHLAGLDFAAATRLAFAVSLLAAGWGACALVSDDFGPLAGVVAGVAFMFSPYILFDAIQRGGLPELMAFAGAPWALWLARRASAPAAAAQFRQRAVAIGLLAVAALGLVVLSHNMVPIWLSPLLVLACWRPGAGNRAEGWRRAGLAVGIVGATLLVTAFFWLPALAELHWVQTWQALAVHNQDYRNNLLPIEQWFTLPSLPVDAAGLLNPPVVRTMSIVASAAALAAVVFSFRLTRAQRWICLVYALMWVVCFGLATEWARPIWDYVPGMKWFQLPTRFLGLASLGAAGLCGALVAELGRWQRAAGLLAGGLAAALMLNGLPWTYAPVCATPVMASVRDIAAGTRLPALLTAEGSPEFLPSTVQAYPDDTAFAAALTAGQQPERLDRSGLPAGATAQDVAERPADSTWQVNSSTPWTAVYQSFYFPGWTASIDGQAAPITVSAPQGLMQVAVPAGQHLLRFEFVATPLRVLSAGLSLLAALGLVGVGLWAVRRAKSKQATQQAAPAEPWAEPGWRRAGVVVVVLATTVSIKWLYLDRSANPLAGARLSAAGLSGVSHPAQINFGDQLEQLGFDLDRAAVPSGGQVTLTQYWTPLVDIGVPYGMEARLSDDAGRVWSAPTVRPFGYVDYPGTESWPMGAYARDAYLISTLPGIPPGSYWLETSAFRRDVAQTLVPAPGTATSPDPAWARLGRVQVLASNKPPADVQETVETFQPVPAFQGLTLAGWTLSANTLSPGDALQVQLLWQNQAALAQSLTGTLQLIDQGGADVAAFPFQLGGAGYPTTDWAAGSLVRDQLNWRLPAHLTAGTYGLQAGVATANPIRLGSVGIHAPDRNFTAPAIALAVPVQIGFARLLGLTHAIGPATAGQTVTVELAWQSTADTATSYRVYVHLRDAAGNIHAQSDSVPAGWTRPTTGWLPGEYVLDAHALQLSATLAPGSYTLFAGLYDPASGQRLGEASLGPLEVK